MDDPDAIVQAAASVLNLDQPVVVLITHLERYSHPGARRLVHGLATAVAARRAATW